MMKKNEPKKSQKKQLILLGILIPILAAMLVYMFMFSEDTVENGPGTATAPMEIQAGQVSLVGDNNLSVRAESNSSAGFDLSYVHDGIDRFFMSLSGKSAGAQPLATNPTSASLPPLAQASGGAMVKLPELRHPNEMNRVSSVSGQNMPNIAIGVPTQISLPPQTPTYQYVSISGIACNHGDCRASTSAGNFIKGNIIGGGQFGIEKIELITMSGIKTDKRFISY